MTADAISRPSRGDSERGSRYPKQTLYTLLDIYFHVNTLSILQPCTHMQKILAEDYQTDPESRDHVNNPKGSFTLNIKL